jgi:hypothetical protein
MEEDRERKLETKYALEAACQSGWFTADGPAEVNPKSSGRNSACLPHPFLPGVPKPWPCRRVTISDRGT